ncbi:Microphthalmia-associated transcription factor [Labeo rohita]|uniref:Microphthalmia-associated transcription factor n=1 Tax=Labeo rohita TaxID=84645 RepID=A0ABQ8LHF3_LABRO|nr:Microphthalmia-associated transcription factor [Labeo rohita]
MRSSERPTACGCLSLSSRGSTVTGGGGNELAGVQFRIMEILARRVLTVICSQEGQSNPSSATSVWAQPRQKTHVSCVSGSSNGPPHAQHSLSDIPSSCHIGKGELKANGILRALSTARGVNGGPDRLIRAITAQLDWLAARRRAHQKDQRLEKASSRQLLHRHIVWVSGRKNARRNPSEQQHGSSKPPLGSSAVTSRILLRQQLMREQLQEQERREQQRRQSSAYAQPSVTQSPAINVSTPAGLPSATQVPMEVLKTVIITAKSAASQRTRLLMSLDQYCTSASSETQDNVSHSCHLSIEKDVLVTVCGQRQRPIHKTSKDKAKKTNLC